MSDGLAWAVEVDWDGDGLFDGVNEAAYLLSAPRITRGRRQMLRPSGQGFEPVRTGSAVITLSNHDGRYDAWNTSSPLYPNVDAGKDVRIRVRDLSTGTTYDRFYGIIQEINPVGYGAEAKVVIYADDALRTLRDDSVTVNRPYTDGTFAPVAIHDLIATLIGSVQWPARWGDTFDISSDGVRYWYSSGERSAATELDDLAQSFFGYFFVHASGNLRYYPRFDHRSSVETITQSEILKDVGNPQPWTIQRNVVKLRFHVRKRADDVKVWTSSVDDPPIEAGETMTHIVDLSYNGYPAFLEDLSAIMCPSLSPNNYVSPPAGGSLTTTTTNYGVTVFLSVTNNWSVPIYLFPWDAAAGIGSYINGDVSWTERADTISSPRDTSSVVTPRSVALDSLWHQDRSQAYELVDQYYTFISAQHKTPIIQIENRFALQFTPDLFDVITLTITPLGISSETFRVGGIEEEPVGSDTTQAVRTTFYLEPFLEPGAGASFWNSGEWDTATWNW